MEKEFLKSLFFETTTACLCIDLTSQDMKVLLVIIDPLDNKISIYLDLYPSTLHIHTFYLQIIYNGDTKIRAYQIDIFFQYSAHMH